MSRARQLRLILSLYGVFAVMLLCCMVLLPQAQPTRTFDRADVVTQLQPACDYFPNGVGGKPCVNAP